MTHDESYEGNVLYTANYFKSKDPSIIIKSLKREDYVFTKSIQSFYKIINFFIVIPYHIATSKIILLDNIFLAFAYTKFKKNVSIVQLWHGTGSIKKIVLDYESGQIKDLAKKSNMKNTHLIVGSDSILPIYKSAFEIAEEKIYPIGCPRTDLFFDEKFIEKKKYEFYEKYPELSEKKIILYAPTFREKDLKKSFYDEKKYDKDFHEENMGEKNLSLKNELLNAFKGLSEDYVLVVKLHPILSNDFVINKLNIDSSLKNKIYNLSEEGLNSLLFVSDLLITDYSSTIFEYSLLNKKMIFYPYDLEEYEKSQGFYFDYENVVPGHISDNSKSIYDEIVKKYDTDKIIKNFKEKYMNKADGKSTERLYALLMDF
jgi:CDP-ribitol ribitolphosphotransferase